MRTTLSAAALVAACAGAHAQTIDFESLVHGEIVNSQFAPTMTVGVVNATGSPNIGIAFDTTLTGTADPDLEDPWSGGNIDPNEILGRVLIIAENDIDSNNDGIIDNPDDEAARPAGTITLDFGTAIDRFGFDVVDLEDNIQETSSLDFYSGGGLVGSVSFSEFLAGGLFDSGAVFGNNHANRMGPVFASSFGVAGFDRVVINVGGSSAYDNFVIPAPGTALVGLAGMLAASRRRR